MPLLTNQEKLTCDKKRGGGLRKKKRKNNLGPV